MKADFVGPLARDMEAFIGLKHALGYRYVRSEFTLRAFDRFLSQRRMRLRDAVAAWISRDPKRKAISCAAELAVIRQFCLYRRRSDPKAFVPDRDWASEDESAFVPHVYSRAEIRLMLRQTDRPGSTCPPPLVRMLLLTLYCTGIRFGEAARLCVRDAERGVLMVESKGRARWVPFHPSLAREFRRYLRWRRAHAADDPSAPLFIEPNGRVLTVRRASNVIRQLLRAVGLKTALGRVGPRPYDLRHTYACHRLARWYRAGVDVQSRLAWLSAYMGHADLCGTEKYLHATSELLDVASRRFRRRFEQR